MTTAALTCRQCKRSIGSTDGLNLYLTGKLVPFNPKRITLTCPACNATVEWKSRDWREKKFRLNAK